MSIRILDIGHYDFICNAFETAQNRINIISPFIQTNAARMLINALKKTPHLTCNLITRFYREDFITSVSSLQALNELLDAGANIYAVLDLHTKLYLFDDEMSVVGSANFTYGGLISNIELSLALDDEPYAIGKLNDYFDGMIEAINALGDFRVTKELVEKEIVEVRNLIKTRSAIDQPNRKCFGAKICAAPIIDDIDPVENTLSSAKQYVTESKAVLKFEGQASNRLNRNDKYTPNYNEADGYFFTCSPSYPLSLTDDKALYMTAVSKDKYGRGTPIVVGRAKTLGADPKNIADDKMNAAYPWTSIFPHYIEIYDIEVVDAPISECIELIDLIQDIGSNLYPNTIGQSVTTESLKIRHHRKSYIHITQTAANRIDEKLNVLFQKYGKRTYGF